LNSIGIKTSTRTLLKYVSILEETFLFFFLPIFTKKVKNILKYPRKIYCVDVGLRNVTNPFSEDFGIKEK
jgi:predicted AAA+ superfamily ATPase